MINTWIHHHIDRIFSKIRFCTLYRKSIHLHHLYYQILRVAILEGVSMAILYVHEGQ